MHSWFPNLYSVSQALLLCAGTVIFVFWRSIFRKLSWMVPCHRTSAGFWATTGDLEITGNSPGAVITITRHSDFPRVISLSNGWFHVQTTALREWVGKGWLLWLIAQENSPLEGSPPTQESSINSYRAYKFLKNQSFTFQFLTASSFIPCSDHTKFLPLPWKCLIFLTFGQMLFPMSRMPLVLTPTFPTKFWFVLFVTV